MTDSLSWLTLDTWITSDNHWGHSNIIKYQRRTPDNFELMRRLWKETVGHDDPLLHLGDVVCFGDRDRHEDWVRDLPGRKYLIKGNHDKHSKNWWESHGWTMIGRGNKPYCWEEPEGKIVAFSHEPDTKIFGWEINIHGHIHSNPYWSSTPMLDYRNVCVELTDFRPVRLRDVLYGTSYGSRFDTPATALFE